MIPNPNEKFVELMGKHQRHEITTAELDQECAYWLLDCFDEIRWRAFPSEPKEYSEFLAMPFEKRQKISAEFHHGPVIKSFLEQKTAIKNENHSNLLKLQEFKSYLPKEDSVSHEKYQTKINEFLEHYDSPTFVPRAHEHYADRY